MKLNIVLYQPEIALNLGNIIRISACFNANLHIIEPCGFPMDMQKIKRASLDYFDKVKIYRYKDFNEFLTMKAKSNIYLLTTKSLNKYYQSKLDLNGYYIFGSESKGVSDEVRNKIKNTLTIPLKENCRSLNLANSVAIISAEISKQNNYNNLI